jgi:hypothetical protein
MGAGWQQQSDAWMNCVEQQQLNQSLCTTAVGCELELEKEVAE